MTGRELSKACVRTGHERSVRRLAKFANIISEQELAVMSFEEVCDKISQAGYEFLTVPGTENFALVQKDDMERVNEVVWRVER